jgi:hypothetical protein
VHSRFEELDDPGTSHTRHEIEGEVTSNRGGKGEDFTTIVRELPNATEQDLAHVSRKREPISYLGKTHLVGQ